MIRLYRPDNQHRTGEPVVIGIPLARGAAPPRSRFELKAESGRPLACDAHVLDRWADGSARWVLIAFRADVAPNTAGYSVAVADAEPEPAPPSTAQRLRVHRDGGSYTIDTGTFVATVGPGTGSPLRDVRASAASCFDAGASGLKVTLADGSSPACHVESVTAEYEGDLRVVLLARGHVALPRGRRLVVDWRLEFWAGLPSAIVHLTVRNPHRAQHPDGYWELGDPGSILLKSVEFRLSSGGPASAGPAGPAPPGGLCSAEPAHPLAAVPLPFELYQDSSGGENWRSTNHVNREGRVPVSFRGYRRSDQPGEQQLRAMPVVALQTPAGPLSMTLRHFWQNCPKAFEVDVTGITLGLFPRQWDDFHELQGGEQKTHTFAISFGDDGVTETPLHWFREPLLPQLDPEWVSRTGAVPHLTPSASDPHESYKALVNAAIEGDDTFEHKREVVDEYGWRHFGEIYGDHETKYPIGYEGTGPLVSHYNNQYDPVAGFCYQWLRSGDARWWTQFNELASHVVDIDIYHTTEDKWAYNGGLFWHTVHYIDAGKATHRTYPRAKGSHGGGPASEQNYTTGLMLHYFLTGDTGSRDAVVGLAQFVIDIDDGHKTVFRWLASGSTGLASQSGAPSYHGPGRGSGNSLNALLDGFRLTGDVVFLTKSEQLIRRCIHPTAEIERNDLFDVERKWFYTMFLQALGRYIDLKMDLGQFDSLLAYARASLLHYARWMARFEYPFLEKPESLEYPTETWVAQDMRKCEVFQLASRHAAGEERDRFQERASFFFDYVMRTLPAMRSRTLCRPVVLLLSHGWQQPWFDTHKNDAQGLVAPPASGWPAVEPFAPQKAVALRRAKGVVAVAGVASVAALIGLLWL
jgi:hypothetical protein